MPFTVEAKEPYIPALHHQQWSVPDVSVVEAKKKKKPSEQSVAIYSLPWECIILISCS